MINVLISGALGRMGKKVFEAATLNENVKAVCGVDLKEDFSLSNFPVYASFDDVKEKVDVLIDFSAPANLDKILKFVLKNNIPAVLCATGYTEEHVQKVKSASEKIAVFRSGNMSLGVNVLIDLVKKAAAALGGFDIEIIEKHHNQKVDAPSGTALMLADAVKDVCPEKYYTYGREGIVGKRDKNEIGIHAVRGGNIVGDHDVIFAGQNETVTLSHQAFDRSVFAVGAVKAAKYIATKTNGLFDMQKLVSES
jgi:4-hydroxy-tetrahydrodipicolinate reductase